MAKFDVYMDLAFSDAFAKLKPVDVATFNDEAEAWARIKRFLVQHADVIIDGDIADLSEEYVAKNPMLRYLLDKPAGTSLSFIAGIREERALEVSSEPKANPWRLFLFEGLREEAPVLSKKHGAWFLGAQAIMDAWPVLGQHTLLNVSADGDFSSWDDLAPYQHPLSAILVADRYMLSHMDRARDNVCQLLINLLPEDGSEYPTRIMLITEQVAKAYSLEDIHEEVKNVIKTQRPYVAFELSLVRAKALSQYHDRHVFTNYLFMKSGDSFNYFGRSPKATPVNTTLDLHPKMVSQYMKVAADKIMDLAKIVERTPRNVGLQQWIVGPKENPLLDAVKKLARNHVPDGEVP